MQRPWLYFHHGIYISDDRVIQFGSGVRLWDKARTAISAVTLAEFEQGGTAGVVRHGYESWFTGHHPAADEGWKVAARAEFLLKLQPRLRYNLIGHNCEILANMCASGSWSESYQTRRFFTVRTAMDVPLMLYMAIRSRRNLPLPGWVAPVVILGVAATVAVKTRLASSRGRRHHDGLAGDGPARRAALLHRMRQGAARPGRAVPAPGARRRREREGAAGARLATERT